MQPSEPSDDETFMLDEITKFRNFDFSKTKGSQGKGLYLIFYLLIFERRYF